MLKLGRILGELGGGWVETKAEGRVGAGCVVWAVGGKVGALVAGLECGKVVGRIATDGWLRVLREDPRENDETNEDNQEVFEKVYALGDAADISTNSHPTTAEVAVQKGEWLAQHLLSISPSFSSSTTTTSSASSHSPPSSGRPFTFTPRAQKAYLGRQDGVVEGQNQKQWTGKSAWLAWRSGNLEWNRSWRRRVMMVWYWVCNWVDGREIARR